MSCPDPETITQYLGGELSDHEKADLETHIDGCEECRGLIADWVRLDRSGDGEDPAPGAESNLQDFWRYSYLRRGESVGRFVILEKLGEGGMGEVYAAYDPTLDRKIALKVLRPDLREETTKDLKRRLLREAQAMASLSSPYVNAVHDVGEFEERIFVAMEFVDGWTAKQWVQEKRPSWRETLQVFIQAGQGLQAAHQAGLVHRDVKPDNILIGEDGRVRVTDFGLVAATGKASEQGLEKEPQGQPVAGIQAHELSSSLTRTGQVLGSPAYMAPEQFQRQPATAKSDQFSFCVSLYESLYGERPYEAEDVDALVEKVTAGRADEATQSGTVPSWVRQVLLRGIRPLPEDRYESMAELIEDLARDPRIKHRQRLAIGAGLLAIMLMLLTGIWIGRGDPTQCKGADKKLKGVWDQASKEQVRRAFLASGRPYAADTFQRVEKHLDAWVGQWIEHHTGACEATRISGDQSEELLDLEDVKNLVETNMSDSCVSC